jgi:hypothetical protein
LGRSGRCMPRARPWARPRRPATPSGSTTLVGGRLAARPPLARWHSREGRAPRGRIRWSEVPEFARVHVAWIDGRHGSAQSSLPPVDVAPVPDILYRLPYPHEERPRGSKAMLDAAGARARLRDVRPGAWLISPYSGWKWAKWPNGDVGWLPADIELPTTLQVMVRNDMQ